MKLLQRAIAVFGFACLVFGPAAAFSYGDGTPDESPPAEEQACEESGLMGSALGLCVAFCEANDCDAFPESKACEVLRGNYARITGELLFPCEVEPPPDGDA
jgi:hypothetical protein